MEILQAVKTLNAHNHRGFNTWVYSISDGNVQIANRETLPIRPKDAIIIGTDLET